MSCTILLVDDDRTFRSEFSDVLKEEYEILTAKNGEQALRILNKPNIVDLVILDIKMPGIKGTEVLKKIKKTDPEILTVMLTGYADQEVILESLRHHADDFLEKPCNIKKAVDTIETLLQRKGKNIKGIVDKIKYVIEKNYYKNVSLKQASEIVCLSPKYISRIFKATTGMGFNAYKLNLKLGKARELLKNSDLNINEIAHKIGYSNAESFIRIFKKSTRTTPTEYRNTSVQ